MQAWAVLLLLAASGGTSDPEHWKAMLRDGKEQQVLAEVQEQAWTGDADALDWLAWFHDKGRIVATDHKRAAEFYRQAAEGGNAHAQWRLGVMLDRGEGVVANPVEAVTWFRKAMEQGFSDAFVSMGVMYSGGRGGLPQDHRLALEMYREGARRRNVAAFNEIGIVYARGEGVPADPVEAAAHFMIAAAYGHERAADLAQRMIDKLDEAQAQRAVDRANALERDYDMKDSTPPQSNS